MSTQNDLLEYLAELDIDWSVSVIYTTGKNLMKSLRDSNSKLNDVVERNIKEIIADGEYTCGGSFVDDDDYLRHSVVARRQLTCSSPLETTYYSAKLSLPTLCHRSGSTSS